MHPLLLVLSLAGGIARLAGGANAPIAITHVGVVDVIAGRVLPNRTVVIAGRTIRSIGRTAAPAGATVVDGTGKFLIPGLWDMHVHTGSAPDIYLPVLVGYGILGARDTHSQLATVVEAKRAVAAGTRVGPRLFVAGELVDGARSVNPQARKVTTEAEARAAVQALKTGGADFVKVYSALSRELYLAIADEARKAGLPYAGHVTPAITAAEASARGQRTYEHLIGIEAGTSREEAAILAEQWADALTGVFRWPDAGRIRATYDSARAAALFATLRKNQTWQVPTLIVSRQIGSLVDGLPAPVPEQRFVDRNTRQMWAGMADPRFAAFIKGPHDLHPLDLELVGAMYRAGVPILAGTDFPNPYVYPGSSLHDELGLLVKAGLPPAAALRTATSEPARFFGIADSLGTVAPGKVADLVLLDADPLADIGATRQIRAVIQGGRLLDRAALDRLLDQGAAAAR